MIPSHKRPKIDHTLDMPLNVSRVSSGELTDLMGILSSWVAYCLRLKAEYESDVRRAELALSRVEATAFVEMKGGTVTAKKKQVQADSQVYEAQLEVHKAKSNLEKVSAVIEGCEAKHLSLSRELTRRQFEAKL